MSSVTQATAGRPHDADLTEKILDETLRQLRSDGYAALRIERIASAVGCGKATLYRRWENKAVLTAEAIKRSSDLGAIPDTGTAEDDLLEHAWHNAENQKNPTDTTERRHTLWAAIIEPEVGELFWDGFLADRRQMGRTIIARAMKRGELPEGTDSDAILDLLAGLTFYRNSIRIVPMDKEDYRPIVRALTTAPPLITH
ncbi:TetR/AcrR family transcriptional regulator [Pseudarthrobacter sp. P1]|uniref:TetR/AcrR family transcriptional regulator n=1 Tax=Pseudarthrobacter sp. P1 TaxID=3418418 RepID=UPI003CEEFA84